MTRIDDQLLKGASAGDLAGVSQALEQGADVNAKDEYDNTALNWAALWGHAEVVKRLLEAGADLENRGSGGGLTPLANAASRGARSGATGGANRRGGGRGCTGGCGTGRRGRRVRSRAG